MHEVSRFYDQIPMLFKTFLQKILLTHNNSVHETNMMKILNTVFL